MGCESCQRHGYRWPWPRTRSLQLTWIDPSREAVGCCPLGVIRCICDEKQGKGLFSHRSHRTTPWHLFFKYDVRSFYCQLLSHLVISMLHYLQHGLYSLIIPTDHNIYDAGDFTEYLITGKMKGKDTLNVYIWCVYSRIYSQLQWVLPGRLVSKYNDHLDNETYDYPD